MEKINLYYIFILLWVSSLSTIVFLSWKVRIHFGEGMADFFYSVFILVVVIVISLSTVIDLVDNTNFLTKKHYGITIFCVVFFILCLLKISVFRGPMSPWNGVIIF
jgi:hypothetical protein